jgi:hypothetical protein
MKKNSLFFVACLMLSTTTHAATFDIKFNNTFDGTLNGPFVGSGTLSFDGNLADGTYLLSSLNNLAMSFSFDSDTFTDADISNPATSLSLTLYQSGTRFYFDGSESNTDYGGSLDFINSAGRYLSIQPNNLDLSTPYNLYQTDDFFGTYGVVTTPIPAAAWLFGSGLLGLMGFGRKINLADFCNL